MNTEKEFKRLDYFVKSRRICEDDLMVQQSFWALLHKWNIEYGLLI
jgi:hypothetical protein